MPRLPRDVGQQRAIRAMLRLDGVEMPGRGKGSHRSVLMPNGFTAVLLADQLKGSEVAIQDFIDAQRL